MLSLFKDSASFGLTFGVC